MEMSPTFETKKKTIKDVSSDILAKLRSRFGGAAISRVSDPETSLVSEETIHEKTEFPSAVTEKYFQDWEAINLEANPEIKDRMRRNIINAEKEHLELYEEAAMDARMTVEEFKVELQKKIEAIVGESNFFRATSVFVLDKVLNEDGRFKSQFETNHSDGCLNQSYRAQAEVLMFAFNGRKGVDYSSGHRGEGIPDEVVDENKENRPIYGYFSNNEYGVINYDGEIPPPNSVDAYGKITVKIKRERALQKTTIAFQDSLSPKDEWPPTPASKPHFTSFRISGYVENILASLEKSSKVTWGASYTEAQFHGQLKFEDIEAIYISKNNDLDDDEIEEVKKIYNKFKEAHPESLIKLIEY